MAPSPRKNAPLAHFNQTWDQTDTAFLDPGSLPVAKLPRAWERKQETRKAGNGKEKRVWRRYTLRSRDQNTAIDEDEEEHDSRSRPVKKQQRMSPDAMEKTAIFPNGKRRAFKATRWDRRKSVLPRKKVVRNDAPLEDAEADCESGNDVQDATDADVSNVSFSEVDVASNPDDTPVTVLLPESDHRRSTFAFEVEYNIDESAANEAWSPVEQDTTLTNLFRSPVKRASMQLPTQTMDLEYPALPQDELEPEAETLSDVVHGDESEVYVQPIKESEAESAAVNNVEEGSLLVQEELVASITEGAVQVDAVQESEGQLVEAGDLSYPELPAPSPPADTGSAAQIDDEESEDSEMSESTGDLAESQLDGDQAHLSEMPLAMPEETSTEESSAQEISVAESTFSEMPQETEESSAQEMFDAVSTADAPRETEIEPIVIDEEGSAADQTQHISEALEMADPQTAPVPSKLGTVETQAIDITDGLTLGPSKRSSTEHTPRKLRSPSPPPLQSGPDDATMTLALDDDTALLKDFLNRAAASKAEKAATIARCESLQNRRDSDVVRYALASPRKALEAKDPNSPSKYDNEATLDLSQTLTLNAETSLSPTPEQVDGEKSKDAKASTTSRRSSRTRKSRLPAPASTQQAQASKIAVRRADGSEHIVLKKTDAQELSQLTRNNTRKNKQGAFAVNVRLLKLAMELASLPSIDDESEIPRETILGKKNVRWDEQLAYYQESTESMVNIAAEAESLATPDELSLPSMASTTNTKAKSKVSKDKNSTPKIRRVRGLGTANGTPGKGLLAPASFLPEAVQEEKDSAELQAPKLPKPKSSKAKKMAVAPEVGHASTPMSPKLPSLDIAPVGIESAQVKDAKERKSRLATPRKVKLPQPVTSTAIGDGKENQTQTRAGIGGATPKKGIPMPQVFVPPTVGVESGLPRRRARKT